MHLLRQIMRDADLFDNAELAFEPIDVLFFVAQDMLE